jgi:hypothetical protein
MMLEERKRAKNIKASFANFAVENHYGRNQ